MLAHRDPLTPSPRGVIAKRSPFGTNLKHPLIGLSLSFIGAVLVASPASAQSRGGTFFTPPARPAGTFFNAPAANGFQQSPFQQAPGHVRSHGHPGRGPRRHHLNYPYYAGYGPYFYDSGYDYDDGSLEEEPAVSPARTVPAPEVRKAADSVVMELRGDHWVRITTTGPVEATPPAAVHGTLLPAFDQAPPVAPLPAAILVFRDGHQEEATSYTIVGRTIYLKSDYWAVGSQSPSQSPSWTRKVLIADLDVPATRKINSERGTKFALPSRPSEVILRP